MKQTHSIRPVVLKMCAAVSLALASSAALAAAGDAASPGPQFIVETDRIIVKYRDAQPAVNGIAARVASTSSERKAKLDRAGQQFGMVVQESHPISTGAKVFKLDRKRNLAEVKSLAAEMMARDPSIEYAEPDRIMTHMATPTDPRYTDQWHYYETAGGLRLPAAWDVSTGAGVIVAVIDTGSRPHADLSGQQLAGYDFISTAAIGNDGDGRDSDASDPGDAVTAGSCGSGQPTRDQASSWHGTHVAGTVAARTNNGAGVAGVAYNAKVLPVRVLGKCGGYTSDIADAITWSSGGTVSGVPANANKARVLNLSLGGGGACDATTQNAINGARSRGAVVVVAAGNDAVNVSNASPANCSGVIAVAATGRTGGRASYSNFGTLVDVAAPGGDGASGVLSTLNSGTGAPAADSYAAYQGTSMATPARGRRGSADAGGKYQPDAGRDRVETEVDGARVPGQLLGLRHRHRRCRRCRGVGHGRRRWHAGHHAGRERVEQHDGHGRPGRGQQHDRHRQPGQHDRHRLLPRRSASRQDTGSEPDPDVDDGRLRPVRVQQHRRAAGHQPERRRRDRYCQFGQHDQQHGDPLCPCDLLQWRHGHDQWPLLAQTELVSHCPGHLHGRVVICIQNTRDSFARVFFGLSDSLFMIVN